MSTKAMLHRVPAALSVLAILGAGGCASSPPGSSSGTGSSFSRLRFGRAAAAPEPISEPPPVQETASAPTAAGRPALRPRLAAPAMPSAVLPASLDQARARVSAYLARTGFALETRSEGAGALITATRMGTPGALDGQAVCALEAMRRPTISSTDVIVRLTPAAGGVRLEASARFVEIDTKILSGDLARETCRSRGVLESAVQHAALGG